MANAVKNTTRFFKDVSTEMKRVSWPKRKELVRYTAVVIATVAFIAVFFAIVDTGLSALIKAILN